MPVSLKAAKSARVQLLAGVEDLGMDSHRCVRTAARSTDEFIGPFIWQSCARGYCLSHKADATTFEDRCECACVR